MQDGDKKETAQSQKSPVDTDKPQWQFKPEAETSTATLATAPTEAASWTASEFISHEKTTGWYGALAAGGVLFAALVYLLTHGWISTTARVTATGAGTDRISWWRHRSR